MSAIEDLKAEIQAISDKQDAIKTEGDSILTAVQALVAAAGTGGDNQAAIDAAVADIKASVDALQTHTDDAKTSVDAVNAALPTAVPPAP